MAPSERSIRSLTSRTTKVRAAIAGVLVFVASCAPVRLDVTPSAPIVLAVVTWNMHAGRGDLPRLVADLESGRVTGTSPADFIVLLQEAGDDLPGLDRNLFSFFSPVRLDGRQRRGNAILSTLPLLSARAIALPPRRQPRGAVAAEVDVKGYRLFVATAHLENRVNWLRGGPMDEGARRLQAEALLQALPATGPGILGGDMNTWFGEREPAWRVLARRFHDTPATRARSTFRDRIALDHLFFDLPPGWHASRRVLADAYGSDHHPVVGLIF